MGQFVCFSFTIVSHIRYHCQHHGRTMENSHPLWQRSESGKL